MSNEVEGKAGAKVKFASSRFGELEVAEESVITFPSGMIGFPQVKRFVMIDHKPPFSWLHSVEDPNLAFVVVNGFEFGEQYNLKPPYDDDKVEFKEGEEYAILVIVTVRPDPRMTTANLKAPIFVNANTKKAVQVIFDNPEYSTRFSLYGEEPAAEDPKKK
jgi:flagellar assembly factor FliW